MKNINFIQINEENKRDCCGCNVCALSCPQNCITMENDKEGFWYPRVNEEQCISCGKCKKNCPIINCNGISENSFGGAYAIYACDEEIRERSSSGGVFSLIAKQILDENGIVYGAAFDDKWRVHHIGISDYKDLEKLQGSKYTQSNIGNIYYSVQNNLNIGKKVLFSGTPCQIAGLQKYIGKQYENLFTVDILCHGVPSPKVWKKYLDEQTEYIDNTIQNITFRSKKRGWHNFSLELKFKNGQIVSKTLNEDLFMRLFLSNICLRPSCHRCKFKDINRSSDITIGDFWGIENIAPEMDDDKGTSLAIVHSNQGKDMLYTIKPNIKIKEVDIEKALPVSADSRHSVLKHKNRKSFFERIDSCKLTELEKLLNDPIYYRMLRRGKKFLNQLICKQ